MWSAVRFVLTWAGLILLQCLHEACRSRRRYT